MDGMDDLVQFLRAQLDREAARATGWHDLECDIHEHLDAGLLAQIAAARMLEEVPGAVCDCGGPARVLAEVDAKRRMIDDVWGGPDHDDMWTHHLRLLALPYADRPDYRDTWRP